MNPPCFTQQILTWFDHQGRHHLPWRHAISPYRVWISEIMLQQTQVNTVIPYYERFMQKFPSLIALANAKEDEVLHLWTGLGYYSRARNLYKTAQILVQEYCGEFPNDLAQLQTLPGIGRSTAGAILAIGFNQLVPILDGNVRRVLTRYHCIEGWPNSSTVATQLWAIATKYTSSIRPDDYTQAIMDLGATVCTRHQPKCTLCPLQKNCQAHQEKRTSIFPHRKPSKSLPTRAAYFIMLRNPRGEILLEKRPPTGIWGSLWSLPETPLETDLHHYCADAYDSKILHITHWPSFKHIFSHFRLQISPVLIDIQDLARSMRETCDRVWYNPKQPEECGLASPVKKLLLQLAS